MSVPSVPRRHRLAWAWLTYYVFIRDREAALRVPRWKRALLPAGPRPQPPQSAWTKCIMCGREFEYLISKIGPPKTCPPPAFPLPGTSCEARLQNLKRGQRLKARTFRKVVQQIPGYALIDDEDLVPPLIRENF